MAKAPLLSVQNVTVRFGGIVALDGISFDVPKGEIVGLIGPNGAGKTTLFNCLSRLYKVNEGDIKFENETLLNIAPHRIVNAGIGRTFQNLALFGTMTVLNNVMVGAHSRLSSDFLSNALRLPWVIREEKQIREESMQIIEFLNLQAVAQIPVMALPFGTQKRVELARALASNPKILLLDEPASGLNHEEVDALGGTIKQIRDQEDVTVLLVEHHMSLVMAVSDTVVAMDFGKKIAEGTPAQVRKNKAVIEAYLGTPR